MIKKLTAIALSIMLTLTLALPAFADSENDNSKNKAEYPNVMDEADLLYDDEESELNVKLEEISERQKFGVYVLTVDSIDEKTATEFADDAFDERKLGYGQDKDGILLLVSMGERDFAISTHGSGLEYFTTSGMEYMAGEFMPDIGDGYYYLGFKSYGEFCDEFITQAREGEPFVYTEDMEEDENGFLPYVMIPFDVLVGGGFGFLIARQKKKDLSTADGAYGAEDYARPGSLGLEVKRDRFMYSNITSVVIEDDNDGDDGGFHTSSSGESHGGISGKF